jgi:hypothetical protein
MAFEWLLTNKLKRNRKKSKEVGRKNDGFFGFKKGHKMMNFLLEKGAKKGNQGKQWN